jgi:hypothetical protein
MGKRKEGVGKEWGNQQQVPTKNVTHKKLLLMYIVLMDVVFRL